MKSRTYLSRKLVHLAIVGLATIVCILTGCCSSAHTDSNNHESHVFVEKQTTIKANHLPHKQDGNISSQISLPQQIGQKPFRNYNSPIASGNKPDAIKYAPQKRNHYSKSSKQSGRQESAPFAVSAPRLFYVIALKKIVI